MLLASMNQRSADVLQVLSALSCFYTQQLLLHCALMIEKEKQNTPSADGAAGQRARSENIGEYVTSVASVNK